MQLKVDALMEQYLQPRVMVLLKCCMVQQLLTISNVPGFQLFKRQPEQHTLFYTLFACFKHKSSLGDGHGGSYLQGFKTN